MTTTRHLPPPTPLLWDVFCQVVDNFGDLGVCWRLSAELARRSHTVRLWVDDPSGLEWMAPGALRGEWPRVQVLPWEAIARTTDWTELPLADVWIEGFGCEIATEFIAASALSAASKPKNGMNLPVWINLEYLSAESYVERAHTLPSPVMQGPAAGRTKYFFYPGFTAGTGGLLGDAERERDVPMRWDAPELKRAWLSDFGIAWDDEYLISLFCYEPNALTRLMRHWTAQTRKTRLLVTAGRATRAVQAALAAMGSTGNDGSLRVSFLPALDQVKFDQLLHCCDLNFVRGEDSLVRAIWAGKPLVWNIYPQDDGVHQAKLKAFLDGLNAPPSMVQFHTMWNASVTGQPPSSPPEPLPLDLESWGRAVQALRDRLLQMDDLTTQLVEFVQKKKIKS